MDETTAVKIGLGDGTCYGQPQAPINCFSTEPRKCPGCCEKLGEITRLKRHIKSLKTQLKNAKAKASGVK